MIRFFVTERIIMSSEFDEQLFEFSIDLPPIANRLRKIRSGIY